LYKNAVRAVTFTSTRAQPYSQDMIRTAKG